MRTDDFDYNLPNDLIAQAPAEPRDSCRLLVLHREDGAVEHRIFRDIIDYLESRTRRASCPLASSAGSPRAAPPRRCC